MSLVTISAGDVAEYHKNRTPATARLYANEQFTESGGIVIARGSKFRRTFYQEFTASLVGTSIRISSGDAYATTNSNAPNATYTLVIYDTENRELATIYTALKIPDTPNPTTWAALETYSDATPDDLDTTFYTADQVDALLAALVTPTNKATDVIYGSTSLSVAAATLTDPIAVGDNDPRVKTLSVNYSSFADAVSTISTAPTTLVIDADTTVSATVSLPSTLVLRFINKAKITVASGQTLTIAAMEDPGNKQIFVQADATANIRFGIGAVERINIAWFIGAAGLCTNAITQALASCSANGGGQIYWPAGTWTTTGDHSVVANLVLQGDGINTIIRATAGSVGIFKHASAIYNVNIKDLVLDGNNQAASSGYLCTGTTAGGAAGKIRFENVKITRCAYGFRIYDTASTTWQVATISFDAKCWFSDNTYNIHCNSSNNVGQCDAFFEVSDSQWAGYFTNGGQWTFTGEFAGSAYAGDWQSESQAIAGGPVTSNGNASAVVTWVGLPGTPVTVTVPVTIADHSTNALIAAAYRKALANDPAIASFFHVAGVGADVTLVALDPAANDVANNLEIVGAARGFDDSPTSTTVQTGAAVGTQAQGFYISGSHGTFNFIGTQDEGFRDFLINEASDVNSSFNFYGATIQGPVRLNESCTLNTTNCSILNKAIRDDANSSTRYTSIGDIVPASQYLKNNLYVFTDPVPHNFAGDTAGNSLISLHIDPSRYQVTTQFPTRILQHPSDSNVVEDYARVESLTTVDPAALGRNDWPNYRFGRGTDKGEPLYYYDIYREWATGFAKVIGNQTGFLGWDFVDIPVTAYSLLAKGATGGIGYTTGAGGTVTQITSASTSVTLDKLCGQITTVALTTAAGAEERFTVNNTAVDANDVVVPGTTYAGAGTPIVSIVKNAANAFDVVITNLHSADALNAVMVINFAVVKVVTS